MEITNAKTTFELEDIIKEHSLMFKDSFFNQIIGDNEVLRQTYESNKDFFDFLYTNAFMFGGCHVFTQLVKRNNGN